MGDSKFFSNANSKGEIKLWKASLLTSKTKEKKDTLKKIIAAMTMQRDVSSLFMDIVKHMPTQDLALKKLIYLYIINNATKHPEAAILIVNTFLKDCKADGSPLIKALAIRTMGCIRVKQISEYLAEPLADALRDKNAYVRKTAAVCVSKLYDINPTLVEDQGFIDDLRELISDVNAMVVSNAVASLAEIANQSGEDILQMNSEMLAKLMVAMQECSEWGVVFILDSLAQYDPDPQEAQDVIERIIAHLSHSNAAVILSAVRVIVRYMGKLQNPQLKTRLIQQKLPAPLVSLVMNHAPEIQYIALRNISLIIQKCPGILSNQVRNFFCKYNDPQYVKLEKLDIMVKLANISNIDKVLMEFKTYCAEVDIEFVRRSVLAIGRCAIKLDKAAKRCVLTLIDLISNGSKYVIQETVVVIRDIFRKYPNQYERIIIVLCRHLDTLNEPEAKGAMIWILGEYCHRIDNAPELLDAFLDTFEEETDQVQLQMLTAVVKLFIRRPDDTDCATMMNNLLRLVTEQADNPDLRDRGFMYWRLLHKSPATAEAVVLAAKPVISDDDFNLSNQALDSLITNIGTLASIYHTPPEFFVKGGKKLITFKKSTKSRGMMAGSSSESSSMSDTSDSGATSDTDNTDEDEPQSEPEEEKEKQQTTDGPPPLPDFMSGVDMKSNAPTSSLPPAKNPQNAFVPTGPFKGTSPGGTLVVGPTVQAAKGLQIRTAYSRMKGFPVMHWLFKNNSPTPLTGVAVKFDANAMGALPAKPIQVNCAPNGQARGNMVMAIRQNPVNKHAGGVCIQIHTNSIKSLVFKDLTFPAHIFFEEGGTMEKKAFLSSWGSTPPENEMSMHLPTAQCKYPNMKQDLMRRFAAHNVFYVAFVANNETRDGSQMLYVSIKIRNGPCLAEIRMLPKEMMISVRSPDGRRGIALKGLHELITA